jgi:multidrug efflux pump subunit AcrA (membrane-fusion protein)
VGGGITIDAPFSALVRNVHVTAGQAVAAAAPLVDLVRLDTVWVRVPVYVGESNEIDKSASVSIVELGSAADAPGRPARPVPAPPDANAAAAAVNLYYALPNTGTEWRPGQRVGVRLPRRGTVASLVVPTGALLHDAFGGTWVYEAGDGNVFRRQRVQVVDVLEGFAVLTQGPPIGTRVVTAGAAEIFGTEFGVGR